VRVVLNGAFWASGPSFSDSQTYPEYAEQTTLQTTYDVGSGFGPDLNLQVSLFRGLGVMIGYSLVSRTIDGTVEATRPHPLYLARPRTASAELSGFDYKEGALHLDLAYGRTAGRLDWAIFAGATLFQVEADLVQRPVFDDSYPYDELAISSVPSVTQEDSPTGFNAGARLDYRFGSSGRFGVGAQVRYSTASVKLKATPDATEASFDAGGLQAAAGLRLYF
jgi:hypothetical protein